MVVDARSGEVLHARNHDTPLHPASLTKMMTLYIAFEAIKHGEITLDTPVRVSAKAAGTPCSCLGLRAGQTIALRYLIRAAAVRSGNDAATAIAEAISGSEAAFADRMTRTARAMGMNSTTFHNAHGLTQAGHMSTARDMTTLGRQLFFDYPQYYNLFSRRSADAGIAQVPNTNRRFLDAYRGADGIKTGYTRAAGFNLVASAERDGKRIIATVFGGASVADRNARVAELLDMGFARAPTRVAVAPPRTPAYRGGGRVVVADAGAGADSRQPAGKVIRLNTAVARSPVPPLRPRDPATPPPVELVAALDQAIESVVAELIDAPEDSVAPVTLAVVPAPRPEDLVASAPASVAGAPEVAVTDLAAAQTDVPLPAPRPETLAAAPATDDTAAPAPADPPFAVVDAADDIPFEVVEATDEAPLALATADQGAATVPAAASPGETASPTSATPVILLTSSVPPPRPVAGVAPADTGARMVRAESRAEPASVIDRQVSTSSARLWGINVGHYGSRFEAEKVLMQTALAETGTLEGGLRKVQPRSGGFDAAFLGLTRDQADLACRRLQARDRLCFIMAP